MQRLRKRMHVSPASAIATLALVFAMTGGAYAAKHYLITSTKQISPKVLKQLQGRAGPAGSQGPQGTQGAVGANGKGGVNGANGKDGTNGKDGVSVTGAAASAGECPAGGVKYTSVSGSTPVCNGKDGEAGEAGPAGLPCTASGTLPSGKSESGAWSLNTFTTETKLNPTVSFPCPLSVAIAAANIHVVSFATKHTAECPGGVAKPEAASGNFCVFERLAEYGAVEEAISPAGTAGTGLTGAVLEYNVTELPELSGTGEKIGLVKAFGTWAVTAQ
jgi:hypothetical protein